MLDALVISFSKFQSYDKCMFVKERACAAECTQRQHHAKAV